MGVIRRLRSARSGSRERRKSSRVVCRLRCTILARRRVQARVLDVSEGGLCILSPVPFEPRRPLLIEIDVPPAGAVRVEAVAWHLRQVKKGGSGRKAWSIGMMISKAGPGFETLLPGCNPDAGMQAADVLAEKLIELSAEAPRPVEELALDESALEEDSLSAAELDDLDLELLSADELEDLVPLSAAEREPASEAPEAAARGDDTLKPFRVRVKAQTGPRTRTLTLEAVSAAEAEMLARSDLGEEWIVLEVTPA